MARGRMISKSLSTSERRASLHQIAGRLAEFCQAIYPLLVAHADDWGRMPADPFHIKHAIDPTSPRRMEDFERALDCLTRARLIYVYQVGGRQFLEIERFAEHQAGITRRGESAFPEPPDRGGPTSSLSASERDVEAVFAQHLTSGQLRVPGITLASVDRQVRIGNSYIDILCRTVDGLVLVFEVKRQRVTAAAIRQARQYCQKLGQLTSVPFVIGHGIAAGLQTTETKAVIATYDEALQVRVVASLQFMEREMTLFHATEQTSQLNLTKPNLTEKDQDPAPAARLLSIADSRRQLRAAAHAYLDQHPTVDDAELTGYVKDVAGKLRVQWAHSREVTELIDGVIAERRRRRA